MAGCLLSDRGATRFFNLEVTTLLFKIFIGIVMTAIIAGGEAKAAAQYTTVSEEMKITVDLEMAPPVAYFDFDGKTLSWQDVTDNDTHYLRVTVRDTAGGAMPGATVHAAILSLKGKAIGTSTTLHETWDGKHPHYGANIQLQDELTSGNVALKITPGKGRRLGKEDGDFFTKPVNVKFDEVNFGRGEAFKTASETDTETTRPAKVEWPKGRRPYVAPTPYPGAE